MDNYSGFGDPLLDFGKNASSFADFAGGNVASKGERFGIKITNTGTAAADKALALIPAIFDTAAKIATHTGRTCDAIMADGTVITTADAQVVCTGTPKTIFSLLQYIKYNPTIVLGAKMRVDDQEQFDESFYYVKVKPTGQLQDREIAPSVFKNENQNNDLLATVPFNGIQFDNQTVLLLTVRAGRTINIDLFLGASLNTAAALARKQTAAMTGLYRGKA